MYRDGMKDPIMKLPNRLSASRSPALRANRKFALHPLGVAALLMIGAPSWSLPTGGQVVSGQVTIQKPVGSTQLITQGTDKAAIDWTSFSNVWKSAMSWSGVRPLPRSLSPS